MRWTSVWPLAVVTVAGLSTGLVSCELGRPDAMRAGSGERPAWRESFGVSKTRLSTTGRRRYFILEPGYQLRYEHNARSLTIALLYVTRPIDGVPTRVVEEAGAGR